MAVFNSFSFGGVDSLRNGLYIETKNTLGGAEPDVEEYEIPGRDGTAYHWNRRYRNVTVEYDTFLKVPEQEDLPRFTGDIKRWLLARPGEYLRLTDTYDPDHFRMAVYAGGLDIDNVAQRFTRQTISFSCLPYRYRKTGENELDIGESPYLINDTGFDALPLIKISLLKGNLTPTVSIRIDYEDGTACVQDLGGLGEEQDTAVLDCENQLIFDGNGELITYNTLESFPALKPGENKITVTGPRVRSVTVTPRWREL